MDELLTRGNFKKAGFLTYISGDIITLKNYDEIRAVTSSTASLYA